MLDFRDMIFKKKKKKDHQDLIVESFGEVEEGAKQMFKILRIWEDYGINDRIRQLRESGIEGK